VEGVALYLVLSYCQGGAGEEGKEKLALTAGEQARRLGSDQHAVEVVKARRRERKDGNGRPYRAFGEYIYIYVGYHDCVHMFCRFYTGE
jgi:hypothetical protein